MKRRESLGLLFITLLGIGCGPKPPTLEDVSARATSGPPYRLEVEVRFKVHNPNSRALVLSQATATCEETNGRVLGRANSPLALNVPGSSDQVLNFKLMLDLEHRDTLPPFYARPRGPGGLPRRHFLLRGTARFGDPSSALVVPFRVEEVQGVEETVMWNPDSMGLK